MAWSDDAGIGRSKPVGCDWPDRPDYSHVAKEVARCYASPVYFIDTYCSVEETTRFKDSDDDGEFHDPTDMGGRFLRFRLWPGQYAPLNAIHKYRRVLVLKARQLGATWFTLAYALYRSLFFDNSTILLFSRRDQEALEMLRRCREMFLRLPEWLVPTDSFTSKGKLKGSAGHKWVLSNGSRIMAFPCGTGDSYSASMAVIDEADLISDLDQQLAAVKPTVDNGGKLILLSRSQKTTVKNAGGPTSPFKNLCRAAMAGKVNWKFVFMPWYSHPLRTNKWYGEQVADSLARTFSMDRVHEQYPATAEESLAANQQDKRFPESAVAPLFKPEIPLNVRGEDTTARWREIKSQPGVPWRIKDDGEYTEHEAKLPSIPGLRLYRLPEPTAHYTVGADPAQGMPTSNDSAIVVINDATGEEVASVDGKLAPKVLARYAAELSDFYRSPAEAKCAVMVENNNHGHAFIQWWSSNRLDEDYKSSLLNGLNGQKGWTTTGSSKETMYHRLAQRITDKKVIIHTRKLYDQVCSIESTTLESPEGMLDDSSVALGLAVAGADTRRKSGFEIVSYGGQKAFR